MIVPLEQFDCPACGERYVCTPYTQTHTARASDHDGDTLVAYRLCGVCECALMSPVAKKRAETQKRIEAGLREWRKRFEAQTAREREALVELSLEREAHMKAERERAEQARRRYEECQRQLAAEREEQRKAENRALAAAIVSFPRLVYGARDGKVPPASEVERAFLGPKGQ